MSSEPYDPYIPNGQGSQDGPRDPRTDAIQKDINKTVDKMRENIDNLARREHNLDQLQQKTGDLADTAGNFRRSANKVRKKMWWNEMKMRIWLAIGIVVLLAIIIIPAVVATRQ
ncbi:synaptobrevin [Parathielavia hyrcaniae]|uniref:Synaptobrevin n=1 Tax=Parathielavia hyrcaniae TaxID=113614 RepID=A0AAN6Q3I6_9PEZI|nr:synaptobrevin [Parathielavia hyrcaniae]